MEYQPAMPAGLTTSEEGTTDRRSSPSFWRTVPGVLTAFAAVITAIGGMIAVLLQAGIIGGTDNSPTQPAAAARTAVFAPATTSTSTVGPSAGKPWADVEAVITAKDGTKTKGIGLAGY